MTVTPERLPTGLASSAYKARRWTRTGTRSTSRVAGQESCTVESELEIGHRRLLKYAADASSLGGVNDPKLHPPPLVTAKDAFEVEHRERTAVDDQNRTLCRSIPVNVTAKHVVA